jgi:AraC-like DNA-binding protein
MIWLSGTLGEALERMIRHYAMASPRRVFLLEINGESAHFRSLPAAATAVAGRVLTEFLFAQLVVRARTVTGGAFAARAVRFRHAGTGGPRYRDLFGVDPEFGAAYDEIELDTTQLELRFQTADADTSNVLEERMTSLARPPVTFLEELRRAVSADLDASSQQIAHALGISERTLRRRLDEHGASLRGITDQLRRERADELLASGLSVKEVAARLGFSEPSAFSRAYKRWSGQPPKARRDGH